MAVKIKSIKLQKTTLIKKIKKNNNNNNKTQHIKYNNIMILKEMMQH